MKDLHVGDFVSLLFKDTENGTKSETMWVKVKTVGKISDVFTGELDDRPAELKGFSEGDVITFHRADVIQHLPKERN